jgi:hypothetical protein
MCVETSHPIIVFVILCWKFFTSHRLSCAGDIPEREGYSEAASSSAPEKLPANS